ncbi:MAG TPA: glycoside hydrolase domain-containing protein [Pseudonocardiaceae bacterium]|nr:glycoside hydrolase domain-containing protein [Pseudonocardiaceae bacterium]
MTLGKLLDWSQARPPLTQIKAHGYSAAYRYVCSDSAEAGLPGKRLTPAERDQILHAGLDIGLHGEDEAGAARKGYTRGLAQGKQWANYAHRILNAPKGMTIVAAIDYDTSGVYPTVVRDYLHGVTDGLDGQYRTGVYGSIYVVDAALAEKTAVHGVQTNAWSHGKISAWAHVYQHGPSEFPGTDYNDVLRVPHGTWLQTLGGDDMTPEQEAKLDAVLSAVTTRDADGAYRQIKDFRDDNTHPNTVPGIKKSVSDTSAAVLTAVATLAAKVTDLADAVAQIQTASGGGPATITLTGTSTPSAP